MESGSTVSSDDSHDWIHTVKMTEFLFFRHAESFNNVLYEYIRKKYGQDISESFIEEQERALRQQDSALSERGYQQLSMLKTFAKNGYLHNVVNHSDNSTKKNINLDDWIIVSSPMKRCLLTAQALADGLSKPIVYVHPRLYESGGCHGIGPDPSPFNSDITKEVIGFPGSTTEEIEKEFPTFKCLPGMEKGWYHGREKEETFGEFQSRCNHLIQWLWSLHNTKETDRFLFQDAVSGESIGKFKSIMIVIHGNLLNGLISGLQSGGGLITHNNTGYSHIQLTTGRYDKQYAVVKYINKIDHLLVNNSTAARATADRSHYNMSTAVNNAIDVIVPTDNTSPNSAIINNNVSENNSDSSSNDADTSKSLVTGNDTIKDHWLQEFQPNY